jgi:hypothetical protein
MGKPITDPSYVRFHVGRSWEGHRLEDACVCAKAPCGLIENEDPECDQHGIAANKTLRQIHRADQCPGPDVQPAAPRPPGWSQSRATASVFAHVLTERNMQRERYSADHDAALTDDEWDGLIESRLGGSNSGSRYVRLVQVAALAVAAAEQEAPRW